MTAEFLVWYDENYPKGRWDGTESLSRDDHRSIVYAGWVAAAIRYVGLKRN